MLLKLRLLFPDEPLTLVLDNARYQRCRLVIDVAALLEIDLLFLPPYSPNLNLIERLWKFVRKTCLTTHYYASFDAFKQALTDCLAHTHDRYKADLTSLLTLNFQSFDNVTL